MRDKKRRQERRRTRKRGSICGVLFLSALSLSVDRTPLQPPGGTQASLRSLSPTLHSRPSRGKSTSFHAAAHLQSEGLRTEHRDPLQRAGPHAVLALCAFRVKCGKAKTFPSSIPWSIPSPRGQATTFPAHTQGRVNLRQTGCRLSARCTRHGYSVPIVLPYCCTAGIQCPLFPPAGLNGTAAARDLSPLHWVAI